MRRHSRVWALAGLLAATVTFSSPQVAAAAISFVQANASTNDAAASTIAQAFTTANTAGNLIVVAVSWGDNAAPSIRATDTLGNTYAVAISDFDPGNRQGLAILYASNIRAGANTVTVTLGTTGGYRRIIVSEYSGITTTSPLDVAAGSSPTCTVSLHQTAPTNGTTVGLSSNDPSMLPVPASVTVPANSASTTFSSPAGSVTSIQIVTLIATLNATSVSTTVTVVSNQAQLKGAWAGPFTWPIVAIHMALLPNGKVLAWDLTNAAVQLWDPAANTFTDVSDTTINFNYFCAGQTALGDGRILVDGGHIDYDIGVRQVHALD